MYIGNIFQTLVNQLPLET